MWSGGNQAILFANVKIAGVSAANGRLFVGVKVLKGGALDDLRRQEDLQDLRTHAEGTLIDFGALGDAPVSLPEVPFGIPMLQYWKERF
jgi:hypothetical protein